MYSRIRKTCMICDEPLSGKGRFRFCLECGETVRKIFNNSRKINYDQAIQTVKKLRGRNHAEIYECV